MLPSFVLFLFSFRKLGDEWSVDQDVTDELEAFTCLMYDYTREKSVDSVRSIMLKKMVGENEEPTMRSKEDLGSNGVRRVLDPSATYSFFPGGKWKYC